MPKLIVSDANIDEDVAGAGLLYTLGGGVMLMFAIGTWMFGVRAQDVNDFVRDAHG